MNKSDLSDLAAQVVPLIPRACAIRDAMPDGDGREHVDAAISDLRSAIGELRRAAEAWATEAVAR